MSSGYVRLDHSGSAPELSYLNRSSDWVKSSFSGNCGCVEICIGVTEVLVRDTKDRTGPVLSFTFEEWKAHLAAVKNGEHELPVPEGAPQYRTVFTKIGDHTYIRDETLVDGVWVETELPAFLRVHRGGVE